jgi:Spy/CpxP family protein refolding chaperone
MKGGHMNKPKLIGGLILVFILGALVGIWGLRLSLEHRLGQCAKGGQPAFMPGHRMEGFAKGGQPPCMYGHRMEGCEKIINELGLTADQKKKVDDILTKNKDERKKLMDSLREAHKQLTTLLSAKEFDEAAFRKSFQQVSSITENLAVLRAKMIPELRAVLSPEQVGYLKGRMEARKEFCEKNRWCSRWEHHGALAKPDMTPQNPQEQGEKPNP